MLQIPIPVWKDKDDDNNNGLLPDLQYCLCSRQPAGDSADTCSMLLILCVCCSFRSCLNDKDDDHHVQLPVPTCTDTLQHAADCLCVLQIPIPVWNDKDDDDNILLPEGDGEVPEFMYIQDYK